MISDIYKMRMHEADALDGDTEVRRVPGGWIYSRYDGTRNMYSDPCFVPFNNEFMECSEKGEPSFNSPASPVQHAKHAEALREIADNMEHRIDQQPVSVGELIRLIEMSVRQLRALQ